MYNLRWLEWIDVNITDLCNLTCSFCPRSDPKMWPNQNIHMDPAIFKKITDELIAANYKGKLSFTGRGESTLSAHWKEMVDIMLRPDRTYFTHVTTNGVQIKKYWDDLKKFDKVILNTYTTREELEKRKKLYTQTDNGGQVVHKFKPDTGGDLSSLLENKTEEEIIKLVNFLPDNRGGFTTPKSINRGVCPKPINYIFINYDGTYQLCCNDWKYQTPIDNVKDTPLLEIYLNNNMLNKVRGDLIFGDRTCTQACSECDAENFHDYVVEGVLKDTRLLERFVSAAKAK